MMILNIGKYLDINFKVVSMFYCNNCSKFLPNPFIYLQLVLQSEDGNFPISFRRNRKLSGAVFMTVPISCFII